MNNHLIINKIESIVKLVSNDVLLQYFSKVKAQSKADGSLITQADVDVQNAIKAELSRYFPEYGFFAEELTETELTSFFSENHSGYWCLDPIDGTSNFAATLPYFSISLALVINKETVLGLIYDPVRDECFTAVKGEGAQLNGQKIIRPEAPQKLSECIAIVDFKRLPNDLATKLVTQSPYRSQRSFGSIALDWCWLALGRVQVYLHGKQMLWDYAAGLLIAEESGCVSCTIDNDTIFEESLTAKKVIASIDNSIHKQWLGFIKI
ncbi:MAG: inositol monophosphatase family protein [gamma proteobacterium symbiont of Bathyaustriella thionipta]|nr:inositol monophosphatase family protein [gamma proteobacterium symbiont of Bathyaustriella thionipta]MCU7949236.1 inositol monophosphatase family protein [gamma proteobacterium symbiont of Bathyaustriella thionipta]MCU7954804.1 inositol monophosphatase family protein [gamma proteobacterium symbiont of Bathyaustriella thionipta]MCU7955822.1 inositol monophosphatase family protein [gamma proteobacterium symbiont of Bathyaustriella thionipta]MCU7967251.1 inositol monophosphatase family protein 